MAIMPGFPQRYPGLHHETYLPTFQDSQGTYPRFSGSHEDPRWPRCHQCAPGQGPQAPRSLTKNDRTRDPRSARGRCCLVLRLKTRSQFQAVLACSKLATSTHFAVHQLASDSPSFHSHFAAPGVAQAGGVVAPVPVWLGAMVPKRWARRAVNPGAVNPAWSPDGTPSWSHDQTNPHL